MLYIGEAELQSVLDFPSLIDALRATFAGTAYSPERHRHTIEVPGAADATLLLMPAWKAGEYAGVKVASIFPSNVNLGLPSVSAEYTLLDGRTGRILAAIDGRSLTALRTAAASALASRYLSRPDSEALLMIGAGRLAGPLVRAHAVERKFDRIILWNRTSSRAFELAGALRAEGLPVEATTDLRAAVDGADIISSATLSDRPMILGAWVRPGTHVDLVGAYKPGMRESDDELVRRSSVYVDTIPGAREEAGDLLAAQAAGVWKFDDIRADLRDLATGESAGRTSMEETTLFKSVGASVEDLAAAILAYERISGGA